MGRVYSYEKILTFEVGKTLDMNGYRSLIRVAADIRDDLHRRGLVSGLGLDRTVNILTAVDTLVVESREYPSGAKVAKFIGRTHPNLNGTDNAVRQARMRQLRVPIW